VYHRILRKYIKLEKLTPNSQQTPLQSETKGGCWDCTEVVEVVKEDKENKSEKKKPEEIKIPSVDPSDFQLYITLELLLHEGDRIG
jgi:hypothetical protein